MGLKNLFEKVEHHFEPGGKYAKWYVLYEAVTTVFYTPGTVTRFACTRYHRSKTYDDPCLVICFPSDVLGNV